MPGKDNKAYKGMRGSIRAALTHHPDKFSKEACKGKDPGKLCPYAIFTNMKKKGAESHYKELPHTTSGRPEKKPEFKDETYSFAKFVNLRDLNEAKKKKKMEIDSLNGGKDMP